VKPLHTTDGARCTRRGPRRLHPLMSRQALWWGLAALLLTAPQLSAAPFRPGAAVLDFQNVSGYSGRLLARRAADQLALDLGGTGRWRVIDRSQTRRAAQQRDLRAPYAVGLLQELAHALSADVVFTGAVQKLEVNPKAGSVRLTVLVEAVDQVSGQSALATVQTGEASRRDRAPAPTDVMVGEALAAACGQAARVAAVNTGLLATVTDPGDGKALRLRPAEGVKLARGYRLLLYRAMQEGDERVPGKLIAALMVTDCGEGGCKAQVLARAGDIHTDDMAASICGKGQGE
jgi:hypothetical protein